MGEEFDFGCALKLLKAGKCLTRKGWNGSGMYCFLVPGSEFQVSRPPLNVHFSEGTTIKYRPHIDLKTADGSIATWAPSNSDALAEDWMIFEKAE